jgi:hypothetical protein
MIYVEALTISIAILITLNFIFTTFTYGLALAMGKISKFDMGYVPLACGVAWGIVFLLHNLR